jgi:transcriptional regulator with XRE-family HTH domain
MSTAPHSATEIKIGLRLKHARLAKRLKLRELAEQLDCSESFISKAENDKVRPSLAMLHKMVRALEINIPSLFADDSPNDTDQVFVTRAAHRTIINTGSIRQGPRIGIERLILTARGSLLEANIHVVEPGGHTEGDYSHDGEELGYVLKGRIEVQVAGKWHVFEQGDSFAFRSELRHGYRNSGTEEARILWVNTPPTF